mgnify:CR=1 FL=1
MTTEADYLHQYAASRFPSPLVTVDSALFTLHQQALCVLLVERAKQPQKGRWGLPGGFIDIENDDSTRATALRKLPGQNGGCHANRVVHEHAGRILSIHYPQ